jgi:hypothetical protein
MLLSQTQQILLAVCLLQQTPLQHLQEQYLPSLAEQ